MSETLILTLILLSLYLYSDYNYRKRLREKDEFIKDLEMKFMSRDLTEYVSQVEDEQEEVVQEEDPYIDLDSLEERKTIEEIERAEFKV